MVSVSEMDRISCSVDKTRWGKDGIHNPSHETKYPVVQDVILSWSCQKIQTDKKRPMRLPLELLTGQIIAQLSIIPMVLYAEPWQWGITAVMYFGIMTFGLTMGYHRYFSHRVFTSPLWFEYVMLFFAHIMMIGPAIVWVANHRQHHKFTDTDKDPHSPKHKGYFYAHFLQVLTKIEFKYVRDMLKVPRYRIQVKFYWTIIGAWALLLTLTDPSALVYAWLAPAGFAKLIGSLVFSYSHRRGEAHSDWWVGMITFGEGFHKQHHENQRAKSFHKHDIGGMIINRIDR